MWNDTEYRKLEQRIRRPWWQRIVARFVSEV
jgi:hypothetical protein